MTDTIRPGQETGAPEGGENKPTGEIPAGLQPVDSSDQIVKDPALDAGSSINTEGNVLTDEPVVTKQEVDNDPADQTSVSHTPVEQLPKYTQHPERQPRSKVRNGLLAGVAALAVGAGAFLFGRSGTGEAERVVPPDPIEQPGLPGQPEQSTPPSSTETGPQVTGLSEDPFKTPFGQAIEYEASPKSLGSKTKVETEEDFAETDRNGDLADLLTGPATDSAESILKGKKGKIFVGCAVETIDYKLEGTGEIKRTTEINVLPSYYEEKSPDGTIKRVYLSAFDEDSFGGIATEGKSEDPNDISRVAYAAKNVRIIPFLDGDSTIEVELDGSNSDAAKLSSQRGAGGFVVRPVEGDQGSFVAERPAVVLGELSPEELETTCKQLVVNTGYPLSKD